MKNAVFVLWLEGVHPHNLPQVPSVSALAVSGADLHLAPAPLVEKRSCTYQVLTGMKPGKLGYFDALYPEEYLACEVITAPYGVTGRLLPDLLRSRKLAVTFVEMKNGESFDLFAQFTDKPYDCAILRLSGLADAGMAQLDAVVQKCREVAGPEAHFMLLTDVWNQEPHTYVNINDFLADIGLLEVAAGRPHERPRREDIAWSQTLAYGLGAGQVWVNLRGRESQGIVNAGKEYLEVCEALKHELSTNWLDPVRNQPVVQQVLSREEAFAGDYVFQAPDLAVVFQPGYAPSPNAMRLDFDGKSVSQEKQSTSEALAPFARLIGSGPAIVPGFKASGSLIDIVPTLLYLLDQPISQEIDGNVISTLFTQSYRAQTAVRYVESDEALLSDEEEGLIVDRLRDLGYV